MDWLNRMNEAIAYIENKLDGDISFEKAAQIAASSQYQFQRLFSYIIGVPVSEYIRRRRLTKAAFDLQNGGRVIDVSMRYGYESPTAFNRAFQTVHGISPSAAQKPDTILRAYPRVSFQIIIKGVSEMEYQIVKKEAFRIVGVREPIVMDLSYKSRDDVKPSDTDIEATFKRIPIFWQESHQNGKIKQIVQFIEAGKEPQGLLGITLCSDNSEKSYYYIAAVTDKPIPEGMYEETIPACTWAVFSGAGAPNSIQELMTRIYSEWLPTSGYEWANAPDIEVYLDDNPVDMKYQVWLPIIKK